MEEYIIIPNIHITNTTTFRARQCSTILALNQYQMYFNRFNRFNRLKQIGGCGGLEPRGPCTLGPEDVSEAGGASDEIGGDIFIHT